MEEEDAATATLELARRGAAVHRLGEAEAGGKGNAAAPHEVARRGAATHGLGLTAAGEEGTTAAPL